MVREPPVGRYLEQGWRLKLNAPWDGVYDALFLIQGPDPVRLYVSTVENDEGTIWSPTGNRLFYERAVDPETLFHEADAVLGCGTQDNAQDTVNRALWLWGEARGAEYEYAELGALFDNRSPDQAPAVLSLLPSVQTLEHKAAMIDSALRMWRGARYAHGGIVSSELQTLTKYVRSHTQPEHATLIDDHLGDLVSRNLNGQSMHEMLHRLEMLAAITANDVPHAKKLHDFLPIQSEPAYDQGF